MKTSNILFASTIIIISASIFLHDLALKAEYLKSRKSGYKEYKKTQRFNGFKETTLSKFEHIDLRNAEDLRIEVEHGKKAGIWMRKSYKEKITVSDAKNTLTIDFSDDVKKKSDRFVHLIIVTPELKSLRARLNSASGPLDGNGDERNVKSQLKISGFNLDSLELNVATNTEVQLNDNSIRLINAFIGSRDTQTELIAKSNNTIASLNLTLLGKSRAAIEDTDIKIYKQRLSDSATVSLHSVLLSRFFSSKTP